MQTNSTPKPIIELEQQALSELANATQETDLENWRISYLGRKGKVTLVLRSVSTAPEKQRAALGKAANQLKAKLLKSLDEREKAIQNLNDVGNKKDAFDIDITLPGRPVRKGALHPTTQIIRDISKVFDSLGFKWVEGPEVESDSYNFQKLNIPIDHPARDMWNSLWIENKANSNSTLLRTHTSPMQIRIMETHTPPIRVIVPGKTYRYEATDATHEWQFAQIEGLAIDRNITFADLKGTLEIFAKRIFGEKRRARFRCDFFPFVEPGAEMSIDCFKCEGKGCRVCGFSGWIEIMGAGMVHPKVLRGVGYDPEEYSGFAFGMGAERIAMLKHSIEDVRDFYANDLDFIKQLG